MTIQAIANAAGIAASVAEAAGKIASALQTGTVLQIKNASATPLSFSGNAVHDSGEFAVAPDPTIPPNTVSIFGVKGLVANPPKGWLTYNAVGRNLSLSLSWEVPLIGAPTANCRLDGGARDYYERNVTTGLDGVKGELSDRRIEVEWRRCMKCGSLNHQTGGLDYACAANGTHDNSVSASYKVIPEGISPWRRCSKCECMVTFPGPCYGGGIHDVAAGPSYTLVSLPGAPGEAGWRACGKCGALVVDESRSCPAGGSHLCIPAPSFTVLNQ